LDLQGCRGLLAISPAEEDRGLIRKKLQGFSAKGTDPDLRRVSHPGEI
jgi:hypothetical protein